MSTAATTHHELDVKTHKHPNYLGVFITLAVITAIITVTELFLENITHTVASFAPGFPTKNVILTSFVIMSLIKATLVAMYYMHLKFDSFIYSIFFITPIIFALFLVLILAIGYII
jgi:cytochrome c oxidase subunit 4